MPFEHLNQVKKSYLSHLGDAFSLSLKSLQIAGIFFIHGIYPDIFKTTGSDYIDALNTRCKVLRDHV